MRNVSNSDSDLARHRITAVVESKEARARGGDREKKSPSLSNLTHQDGVSRYKVRISKALKGFWGIKHGFLHFNLFSN